MWVTETIIARALICLAVFMLPAQGLPSASCGCASDEACCQQSQFKTCCCSAKKVSEGQCCCSNRAYRPAHSCCGKTRIPTNDCKCGLNCQCQSTSQPKPVAPPVESNTQTKKAPGEPLTTRTVATIIEQNDTRCPTALVSEGRYLAALERCVCLCRFTL